MKIAESNPFRPVRLMIYGVEGVGKSTLGAKADDPIFITPEGGIDRLTDAKGARLKYFEGMNEWDNVVEAIEYLTTNSHQYKTLVIDSADWLESLCHAHIIGSSNKSIIHVGGGYGNGYRESQRLHAGLIKKLSNLRDKKDMNIVVTAHAHVKGVKDPSMMEDYDSYEIKCHEMVSSIWREWVDALLFARFQTFVKADKDSTQKARAMSDGTRVIYSRKQPSFQAKNRYGLPEEQEFTEGYWGNLMEYVRKGVVQENPIEVIEEIADLTKFLTDETLLHKVSDSVVTAGSDLYKLKVIKKRLQEITGGK